jgi:hypothetical protein
MKNLTPSQASPMRKRELVPFTECKRLLERDVYMLRGLAIYKVVLSVEVTQIIGVSRMLRYLTFSVCQKE